MVDIKKLEWQSEFSVDIEEIDGHQKKVFELFNELIDLKRDKKDAKECANKISEINDFTKLFFSTEERLLKKKGYPDFQNHTKAHRQFTKNSIGLRREIADDVENLTDEVIEDLRKWLIDHILGMDALYKPYLRINKYIEESKHKN